MIRFLQAVVVLLVFAGLWLALLVGLSRATADGPRAPVLVEMPDLDALEARLVRAEAVVRHWQEMRDRHGEATEIACEQLADAAMRREVR